MAEDKRPHQLRLVSRQLLEIDGVTHVDSFDDDTIVLATEMGTLAIHGHNLRIQHLDLEHGTFQAAGEFNGLDYSQRRQGKPRTGWQRLLR
ncbi:conserved protein of unknown function [Candidatus Hydrogenisulfobacillus filiaventi]|uniref:Sporulation protein YabP n=1 Tax=Candidatus Hydrogenisulfobacillus filiaventi TaxID=2707344 RepID=A0A6F8ZK47_9FIRM|nr:conserved protein of unknown function [Candidatus Hydrogenisulfobacillus filiaventi]